MDNTQFGAFLAQLRREQGLTQRELADLLHVTDKAVSKWETGKGFPDIKQLEPLAQTLGVTLVELIQGERSDQNSFTAEETGAVAVRAMDRSQKVTARRYLGLLTALLFGIGGLCLLRLIPFVTYLYTYVKVLWMSRGYGIIGGAEGPTAILTTSRFLWWDLWGAPAAAAVGLVFCTVLTVKVRCLEQKLK